ncbi:MAG: orotate phosphoribosyltransferase [Elusimicrobia bacterium]|nr:orotate phosphoribosyltransferase [Elusimicrobiota bacterium]MDE2238261.1 orotate phosphoribosyltransferase [Elusimicrobiota bacterium]MDE2424629.1 orotate phosphoribosyltransferase [Elusimicrobiota bacterium]
MTLIKKMDVLGLLQEHGAVVPGHFELANGLHSSIYIQTALVLQYPHVAHKIARALAGKFSQRPDVVISPGMSSVVLGQEVARVHKCRAIFTERNANMLALRRDFRLERGEKAMVIEDVLTTGRLTAEIIALAQAYGCKVLGVGAIVDRSTNPICLSVPVRTLISFPLEASAPASCPQCAAGVTLTDASGMPTGAQEGE